MHIPDTPMQCTSYLPPALLLGTNITSCIPPATAAEVPSSSDMSSIMNRCKELKKEKKELTKFLKDYKFCLQNAEQEILKHDSMLSALEATVSCLLEDREQL